MTPTPTERTAAGEAWHGIPIVAYHWEEPSGFSPPSSTMIDKVAFHWSTGPKDAEPLVRLKDVAAIADGWLCFHCGDRFTDRREAKLHFGGEMDSVPACKIKGSEGGLVKAVRDAQLECARLLQQLHDDGGEVMQAYHSMSRRFSETARACEETGFQRGVDQCFDLIRALLEKHAALPNEPEGTGGAFRAAVRELIEGKPE